MPKCYARLNLPKNPLRDNFELQLNGDDYWHIYTDAQQVLSQDLLEQFNLLGLMPNKIVIFGSTPAERSLNSVIFHRDLYWENGTWVSEVFAVNWELSKGIQTRIFWMDTVACKEVYPQHAKEYDYPDNIFNGVTYGSIWAKSVPSNAKLIEYVDITDETCPILFRTEIAHGVQYKLAEPPPRFMVSVRFSREQIASWDKALEIFGKVIIDK